jgi:adenylosuccinate lyase
MVEILATYDAERPQVQRLDDDEIRVIIHFGHTSVDIIDACRTALSISELDDLIDLWANPGLKRTYTDLPEGLLVRRAE